MRLISYLHGDDWRGGVQVGDRVHDIHDLAAAAGLSPQPMSVRGALQAGPDWLSALAAAATSSAGEGLALSGLRLGPPVPDPDKIICLGLNYREHANEAALDAPPVPMLFAKFRTALVGPGDAIVLPAVSDKIDYEGELVVVIGRRAKSVPAQEALGYVAGYAAFNDVTARDVQVSTSQWMAGKMIDTFGPCGPALVTADEVGDPQALRLVTRVNGTVVQEASTAEMIFAVAETIEFISSLVTLEPGDLIATGTPAGVGFKRDPQIFLRDGDVVEVEIDRIGLLQNRVVLPDGVRNEPMTTGRAVS